jgi:hypothetical protein
VSKRNEDVLRGTGTPDFEEANPDESQLPQGNLSVGSGNGDPALCAIMVHEF